jgi:hypothetical protein
MPLRPSPHTFPLFKRFSTIPDRAPIRRVGSTRNQRLPRLILKLDQTSLLTINGIQARFGISEKFLRSSAFAILLKNIPVEHTDICRKVAREISKKTSKFEMGYGGLWMARGSGTMGLVFPPPGEVHAIREEMKEAMAGVGGIESMVVPSTLFVEVLRPLTTAAQHHLDENFPKNEGRLLTHPSFYGERLEPT